MICVFVAFWFTGQRDIAEFGISLAVALDAFILRAVLEPAAMHLFGDATGGCRAGKAACSPRDTPAPALG